MGEQARVAVRGGSAAKAAKEATSESNQVFTYYISLLSEIRLSYESIAIRSITILISCKAQYDTHIEIVDFQHYEL